MLPEIMMLAWLTSQDLEMLTRQVAGSGRVVELAEPAAPRLGTASRPALIAPGAPPMLSFRLFEGKVRHRYGNLDLVMDDAGH